MTGPLIRVNHSSPEDRKRALLAFWKEIAPVVVKAVEQSCLVAGMQNIKRTEVRRRVELAKALVQQMRFDLGWSKQRIEDVLPKALSAKLVGLEFDLEALALRSSW